MYIPQAFRVSDQDILYDFIQNYSFATLISTIEGKPFATHLPLLLERTGSTQGTLLGHVARGNPHWHAFDGQQEALAIFQGPHAYVSPSWYATSPAVPTWNYTAVHVYGTPRLIDDHQAFSALLDRLIAFYEAGMPEPWAGELPLDYRTNMMQGIVGFALDITRLEGKFKLSQNRSREDQGRVIAQLGRSGESSERDLSALSKRHLGFEVETADDAGGAIGALHRPNRSS